MNPFEMVVSIIFLVTLGKVASGYLRHRGENAPSAAETQEAARLREEVRALKDRVQVLERVITDNESGLRLDREIQQLRDRDRV